MVFAGSLRAPPSSLCVPAIFVVRAVCVKVIAQAYKSGDFGRCFGGWRFGTTWRATVDLERLFIYYVAFSRANWSLERAKVLKWGSASI